VRPNLHADLSWDHGSLITKDGMRMDGIYEEFWCRLLAENPARIDVIAAEQ